MITSGFHFLLLTLGNMIFYEIFYWMLAWGKANRIFVNLGWLQIDWRFSSFVPLIIMASVITIPVGILGSYLVNYAYIKEALNNDGKLWISQFMMWLSTPVGFTIVSLWHPKEEPLNFTRISFAFTLLLLAQVVMRYK